ncbi:hypothetical protein C5S39_07095, partial [Candidatus Methanophagaceae archaeon]
KILFVSVVFVMCGLVVSAQVPPPQNIVFVEVTPAQQTAMLGGILTYNVTLTNNGNVPDIIVVEDITGVPSGWTVELKAAGIPMTLPYKTPLLQSKESYPLTLKVHTPANATAGATITTTIHSYADNTKTDSAVVSATVLAEVPTAYHGDGGGGGALQKVTPTVTPVITPTHTTTFTPEAMSTLTPAPAITSAPTYMQSPTPKSKEIPGFKAYFAV